MERLPPKGQDRSPQVQTFGILFRAAPLRRKNHSNIKNLNAPILPLARPTGAGPGCDIDEP
jgi:hypothetical protein